MAAHTNTPWEVRAPRIAVPEDRKEDRLVTARDADGKLLHVAETFQYQNNGHAEADGTSIANAAFIVLAVNAHDDLVAACTSVVVSAEMNLLGRDSHAVGKCRAALAKAGKAT